MKNLVCFTEEPSAEEMLKILLKRILPDQMPRWFVHFDGKSDLEKKIERKIRGWCDPNSVFLVLRDQDTGDCRQVKAKLLEKIQKTGRAERTVIRIACHELEAFYIGDLLAVEKGLKIEGLARKQNKANCREPDKVLKPSHLLSKLTRGRYQKLDGSSAIAPHLDLENSRSSSFLALVSGIRRILDLS